MPGSGARSAASVTLRPGDLVGLIDSHGPTIAVVHELRGNRASLRLAPDNRPLTVAPRDLDRLAEAPNPLAPAAGPGQAPWRLSSEQLLEALPPRRELGAAWLLLLEAAGAALPEPLPLVDLAELLGDAADPALLASLWLWLQGDQSLFRWRHGLVAPRSLDDLRRLRRDRRRQFLAERQQRHWHAVLQRRTPLDPACFESREAAELALLRRWACGNTDQPLTLELRRALQAAHCQVEPGAIRHLLVDLGQWSRHHLPTLEATIWQLGFSPELHQECRRLLAVVDDEHPGDLQRLDLTGLHSFTIDDDDTQDIDDGLSWEPAGDGAEALWIHIADPGRLVELGSPLDLEARRRGSSLYLARGSLPMFPQELATGPFSLRSGLRCAAWSLRVELGAEGEVQTFALHRSWLRPAYRLSYSDADELIELAPPEEPAPAALHVLMERRCAWRQRQGALQLEQPEGRIRCRGDVAELEVVEPSASRRLVAEAMILAGAVMAEHGVRLGLALPYRSQQASALPSEAELAQLEPGPVRHAAIKRCLSRGHMGVTPAPHFSLGLAAYVQATSPIRRYGDLLVQRQLAALADGQVPLQEAELAALLSEVEGCLRQGLSISRDDQRHWQQVWFEQNPQPSWAATFLRWLRPQDQLALVWIDDLSLELPAECPAGSEPGAALRLRVVQVDSLRDQLRLQASA